MGDIFEVANILDSRRKRNGQTEYYIRWKGFGPEEDSWEPEKNLIHCQELLAAFKKENQLGQVQRARRTRTFPADVVEPKSRASSRVADWAVPAGRVPRQRTPKVQRILGVRHMPVANDRVKQSRTETKTDLNNRAPDQSGRPYSLLRCNSWTILAGVLCILGGALVLACKDILD